MKIGQKIYKEEPEKNSNLFENGIKVFQLGIQALPGTSFKINNSNTDIIIGSTGIYELDLKGITFIEALQCTGYVGKTIIVDYLYEGGSE